MQLDLMDATTTTWFVSKYPRWDNICWSSLFHAWLQTLSKSSFSAAHMWDLLDGLPPDLGHDGALPSEVFIAQTQEVVNHKCWGKTKERQRGLAAVRFKQTSFLMIVVALNMLSLWNRDWQVGLLDNKNEWAAVLAVWSHLFITLRWISWIKCVIFLLHLSIADCFSLKTVTNYFHKEFIVYCHFLVFYVLYNRIKLDLATQSDDKLKPHLHSAVTQTKNTALPVTRLRLGMLQSHMLFVRFWSNPLC